MLNKQEILVVRFILLFSISIYIMNGYAHDYKPYVIKTVVIDPGHGGKDPGTIGQEFMEKDIVLNIATLLGAYIQTYLPDVKVIYTRTSDTFVELHKRADIANKNKADLFISIHVNAIKNAEITGSSTYIMGPHKTDENLDVAKLENSVILIEDDYTTKYEGYDPASPESYIIFSLLQHTYLEQSMLLSHFIQQQFEERAKRVNRGVKQAGFLVLWNTTMPSVLIETGFITNSGEEEYLGSKFGQEIIASAIFRAFREYKKVVEKQSSLYASNKDFDIEDKNTFKNIDNTVKKKNDDIVFKLQIKSSYKKIYIVPDNFKGLKNVEEYVENGIFKYTTGKAQKVEGIIKLQEEIRKLFPDAFVVSFKSGKKIPYKEALELMNEQ